MDSTSIMLTAVYGLYNACHLCLSCIMGPTEGSPTAYVVSMLRRGLLWFVDIDDPDEGRNFTTYINVKLPGSTIHCLHPERGFHHVYHYW